MGWKENRQKHERRKGRKVTQREIEYDYESTIEWKWAAMFKNEKPPYTSEQAFGAEVNVTTCASISQCLVYIQSLHFHSSFLLTRLLADSRFWFKYLRPCHPHGRSRWSSKLLSSTYSSPVIWGVNQQVRNLSSSLPFPLSLSHKMKSNK